MADSANFAQPSIPKFDGFYDHCAQLQALRREFEILAMKEGESIDDYFSRTLSIANKMTAHGERMDQTLVVEKILRSLTSKFNYVVRSIEESNDVTALSIDELQCSLLVHEQRMKSQNQDFEAEQALKVSNGERGSYGSAAAGNFLTYFEDYFSEELIAFSFTESFLLTAECDIFTKLQQCLWKPIKVYHPKLTMDCIVIQADPTKNRESQNYRFEQCVHILYDGFGETKAPKMIYGEKPYDGFYSFILDVNGEEVGSVAIFKIHVSRSQRKRIAEITHVATKNKFKKQGFVRVLMERLEAKFLEIGVTDIVLISGLRSIGMWESSTFGYHSITEKRLRILFEGVVNIEQFGDGVIMCHKSIP